MKTKDIHIQLIELLSKYDEQCTKTGAEVNMTDFLGFMNSNHQPENVKSNQLRGQEQTPEFKSQSGSATDISILIVLLFRYAKGYIKKALKESIIKTADEFSFLITLVTYKSLSKTELIQKQIMEKTSGTEIINRLFKLGLIDQVADKDDKRSIRVSITPMGRTELMKIIPQMQTVSQIVTGNLSETEKSMLAYVLRKLEIFHNDIFLNKKDVELTDLV
jgi:DNA-binding MarR family transcriptional regulator